LSKNHVTQAYKNSVVPLLKKKEMITQNVTLSNATEGGNTKVEQNFYPGLALIDLLGTGPCIFGSL